MPDPLREVTSSAGACYKHTAEKHRLKQKQTLKKKGKTRRKWKKKKKKKKKKVAHRNQLRSNTIPSMAARPVRSEKSPRADREARTPAVETVALCGSTPPCRQWLRDRAQGPGEEGVTFRQRCVINAHPNCSATQRLKDAKSAQPCAYHRRNETSSSGSFPPHRVELATQTNSGGN
jgi:hypothetical protein